MILKGGVKYSGLFKDGQVWVLLVRQEINSKHQHNDELLPERL